MTKFPWLASRNSRKSARDLPCVAPIPLRNRSNGEYFHQQTARERLIERLIFERADVLARRLGVDRREFLTSTMGMATSLAIVNLVACRDRGPNGMADGDTGSTGGHFDVGSGSSSTSDHRGESESGDAEECIPLSPTREFVFDLQTHHVNPNGPWRETNPSYESFLAGLPHAGCGLGPIECFAVEQYIEQIFLNSDTAVAVLTSVPAELCSAMKTSACDTPLRNEEIVASRELVNALARSRRVLNHCMVMPNLVLAEQLEIMQRVHEEAGVSGWKVYTPWGPDGVGYWLDDPAIGLPMIEKGRSLGVKIFCCHKGLPLPGFDDVHTDPRDIGVVAAMFPDATFIVYHSAWLHGGWAVAEGPYDPEGIVDPANPTRFPAHTGINSLIKSVEDNGLGRGSNVYAELGSTWGNLMTRPDQAAHALGKLLAHLGEDNVVWGTDCIWTGSPQPQIEAFLAFQISEQFQETYGYPALTPMIKRKILGLNAARIFGVDPDAMRCEIDRDAIMASKLELDHALGPRRWMANTPAGPRTRREFLNLIRWREGRPD